MYSISTRAVCSGQVFLLVGRVIARPGSCLESLALLDVCCRMPGRGRCAHYIGEGEGFWYQVAYVGLARRT
jgi:hypothetical protein